MFVAPKLHECLFYYEVKIHFPGGISQYKTSSFSKSSNIQNPLKIREINPVLSVTFFYTGSSCIVQPHLGGSVHKGRKGLNAHSSSSAGVDGILIDLVHLGSLLLLDPLGAVFVELAVLLLDLLLALLGLATTTRAVAPVSILVKTSWNLYKVLTSTQH